MRKGQTAAVGVFLPSWNDVLLLELIRGFSAGSSQYPVPLAYFFGLSSSSYQSFISSMVNYRHTALISYVPAGEQDYDQTISLLQKYMREGGKVLSLNNQPYMMQNTISVDIDEGAGGRLAAEYLAGFPSLRSILLVSIDGALFNMREKAFCQCFAEAGKPVEKLRFKLLCHSNSEQVRRELVQRLLSMPKPVGIFFTSSELYSVFLLLSEEMRWRLGQDYQVVSYDLPSQLDGCHFIPRIAQPFYQLGVEAVKTMSGLLQKKRMKSMTLQPWLCESLEAYRLYQQETQPGLLDYGIENKEVKKACQHINKSVVPGRGVEIHGAG